MQLDLRLVNRRIEQRHEHSITRTEITQQRRILQNRNGTDMQQYNDDAQLLARTSASHPQHRHQQQQQQHKNQTNPTKQQTTQQVTTVTKVVREVKHLAAGTGTGTINGDTAIDFLAMPLDVGHLGPDGQPVDYVAMPIGMYPRSQYINYNQLEQQQQQQQQQHIYSGNGPNITIPGLTDTAGHYHGGSVPVTAIHAHYTGYDTYPINQYANAIPYGSGTSTGFLPAEYVTAERTGSPSSPPSNSRSQSPVVLQAAGQPTAQYIQAPVGSYDDMDDYRVTPSPAVADRYHLHGDEPGGMVYGYVASAQAGYGMTTGTVANQPVYGTRPIVYDDQLNGQVVTSAAIGYVDGGDVELQKQMANLSMYNHGILAMQTSPGGPGSQGVLLTDDDRRAAAAAMRWRDPNLTEVINFLNNPNSVIKANAAAYLQHLCYMDDPNKQRTRSLGGIPPLVKLLAHEQPEVYRNACGALRNLSYGRQNDENKRAIKNAGGIVALINLLRRTSESEVKELVTGVIWNMSSCEDLKRFIIDDGVAVIVAFIIIPHSGWDPASPGDTCWSTVFRNASGVLRNVSSAGEYARTKLRDCDGLIDALLYVVRSAIEKSNIGNKIVENCVCILRNLSYRCQEVEDPNYDKLPLPTQSRVTATASKGENLGCFGGSKKKKDAQQSVTDQSKDNLSISAGNGGPSGSTNVTGNSVTSSGSTAHRNRHEPIKGYDLLWQPDVVQSYLALLQSCSNPETLEAAAGALQNLAACYWQPSIEIRAAVRKEKGLPILVELLRMEVDRVVCAVATALRNLAIDQRNKELIGKYAMRDLVQKLPSGNPQHDQGTSDDTIAAVLATLNEVIKKNAEFSRSLLDAGGVERLMNITRQRQKYTPRVLKFAGQVLFTMWQHQELRDVYKKHGWKEQDFVTKTIAARNAAPNSPNNANSTLNRPMASQGGTRYEDRTMKRPAGGGSSGTTTTGTWSGNNGQGQTAGNTLRPSGSGPVYQRNDEIPMSDLGYDTGGGQQPQQPGGVCMYQPIMTGNGQTVQPSLYSSISSSLGFLPDPSIDPASETNSLEFMSMDRCNGRITATDEPLYAQINRNHKRHRTNHQRMDGDLDLYLSNGYGEELTVNHRNGIGARNQWI